MDAGMVVWLTGLPGAGKSTLAFWLRDRLVARGLRVEVLDSGELRPLLSTGLGFSKEDRDTNVRRLAYIARLLARNGVTAIVAAIAPYRDVREEARAAARFEGVPFVEVFVACSIAELMRRDPRGLYARALRGALPQVTGISDPYEPPLYADVMVRTDRLTVDESLSKILGYLEARRLATAMERRAA